MDDLFYSIDEMGESQLSEDDLAVLQAFEAKDNWPGSLGKADSSPFSDSAVVAPVLHLTSVNDSDMFLIFIAEVKEDIASMLQILKHIEQDNTVDPALCMQLQHFSHKLHGTAAVADFPIMSTIASHIEVIAEQVNEKKIYPLVGIYALSKTIITLERHLHELISQGKEPESSIVLVTLDRIYRNLNIDLLRESEKTPKQTHLV
jgi:chemotaxis protein histidine kinase CheA